MSEIFLLYQIGARFIVDATLEEEECMGVWAVVAVDKKGTLCSTQMGGRGGGVDPTSFYEMIQVTLIL